MGYITSGNQIVDAMGMMNISGNVIPQIWYSTITRPNGKPYLLAITLLSSGGRTGRAEWKGYRLEKEI